LFRHIFVVSNARSSLLQTAYYGAYFNARDPRVLHHRRFGYKTGVLTGLGVAAVGGLLFFPASKAARVRAPPRLPLRAAAGLSILTRK
jgi:FHS family L-fucose permease-like MFS transporter